MLNGDDELYGVRNACTEAGFICHDINKVKNRVYSATISGAPFGENVNVFIKEHHKNTKDNLKIVSEIAPEIGHPRCTVINSKQLYLLMKAVPGRPLSHLLPLVTLPVAWKCYKSRYESVFKEIGKQLGTLHAQTVIESKGTKRKDIKRKVDRTRHLEGVLQEKSVEKAQIIIEEAHRRPTDYALRYGDRSPHNIYFDGENVMQIDCSAKPGSVWSDIISLLTGIRLMIARLPYANQKQVRALEETFWQGYLQEHSKFERNELLETALYIDRLLMVYDYYEQNEDRSMIKLMRLIDRRLIFSEIRNKVSKYN